jgi:tetratricopeptide (TPR) repeat protein
MIVPATEETGDLRAALASGRHLLASDPTAAAEQAREILRITPMQRDALRLLGTALRRLGRTSEAEQAELDTIRAAANDPTLAAAAKALAHGRVAEAEHLLRPHLRRVPDDAAALVMLADIGARMGVFAEAETLLRKALALAPAFPETRLALSNVLFHQNRPDEALAVLDELLGREPTHVAAIVAKATLLGQIGDYERAVATYAAALPGIDDPDLWLGYGNVLKTVGRLADSIAAYRRALAHRPDLGEAWWSLANLKTVRLDETETASLEAMLDAGIASDDNRLHIHFALGKALEDQGRYEASFRHYSEGNRIRRKSLNYDADVTSDAVERMRALFTPKFLSARRGQGCGEADPIFIVGMPRAGSTLIEQILSSHSRVEGTSELPYIPALIQRLLAERWQHADAAYPELMARLDADALRALGEAYLRAARAHRKTDRRFFIDKLPNNWMHVGFIHLILPNARIIDARRHPLACCFSSFKQHFARGQGFTYALDDLGRYYRDYARLLAHFDALVPGRVHCVLHEDMVEAPEKQIRRLLAHLELPFEEACLRFHENERAVRTASSEQVRRPINRDGLDRWRAYEPWLGPLKDALGPVADLYPAVPAD